MSRKEKQALLAMTAPSVLVAILFALGGNHPAALAEGLFSMMLFILTGGIWWLKERFS